MCNYNIYIIIYIYKFLEGRFHKPPLRVDFEDHPGEWMSCPE